MNKIIIIGLGGIGSFLALVLCRYLNFTNYAKRIALVDGDRYGRENFGRQNISAQDETKNKAQAQAGELQRLFNTLTITPISQFVTRENASEIIGDKSVVFLAVDNHATRKIVSDQCKRLRDVLLISGGNEFIDGNVQIYLKRDGRSRTPTIEKFHPEIENPEDRNPAELSCEDIALLAGSEQIIFTNLMAASLMLNAFFTITTDNPLRYSEVYFDIGQNKALPRLR